MSEGGEAAGAEVCAACGIAESDEIKLTKCAACESVQYCSDECERDHRQYHEEACEKRAAELRDEMLFKEPESSCYGDCPICFLPLPIAPTKFALTTCCSKTICFGCGYAHQLRNPWKRTCAFCRHPIPESQAEAELNLMKRVEKNDPLAMSQIGGVRYNEGDYSSAFEYLTKAAELGDTIAHCKLAVMYYEGKGVEKDGRKALYHWEEAAIGGHPDARGMLATIAMINGRPERTVKHYIIAANLGRDLSMKNLWECYAGGYISKDNLNATLRTHQAAVDATKSPERKAAEEAMRRA
jgi:TPR repeat protein